MKRQKKYLKIVRRHRRRGHKYGKQFYVYIAICLLLVLTSQIKLEKDIWKNAEPGTIDEKEVSVESAAGDHPSGREMSGEDIPEYTGEIYIEINGNLPNFMDSGEEVLKTPGYEYYSALDTLGRCGYCEACVGPETMPEDDREDIWMVHPSGWRSGQGWERCHIIGFQLTGENANDHNLITGTHSFNVDGMLPFENQVASAAWKGKLVMYRVSPLYNGYELIPRGVHMMAQSIEDDSVSFNVFVFNVEPGKTIDYVGGYVR